MNVCASSDHDVAPALRSNFQRTGARQKVRQLCVAARSTAALATAINASSTMSAFPQQRRSTCPRRVGFLGFDGMTSLDLTGPLEAFAVARMQDAASRGQRCYETIVIGVVNRTFVSASGATFKAQCTMRRSPELDTIVVPGGIGLHQADTTATIAEWLRTRMQTTRRIVSICGGIYPLASAGLLDGRAVTTHWRYTADIVRRFPRLKLKSAAPYLGDGQFYTCGGGTAPIEMSLRMIEDDYGAETALAVAEEFGMSLHRPRHRRDDAVAEYQAAVDDRLAELPGWITSRLAEDLSVEVLAEKACLCPRHFRRVFKRTFKSTPAEFVEQLRISEAERRLATQRASIESVATSVGFKTPEMFRRAFERRVGQTPSRFLREWRLGAKQPPQASIAARPLELVR